MKNRWKAGTAGASDTNVVTVQGIASGTAMKRHWKLILAGLIATAFLLAQLPVSQTGTSVLLNGQQAVTGSAVALPNNPIKTFCIEALIGNTQTVYFGSATVTASGSTGGFELTPGKGACPDVNNTDLVYVIASGIGSSVAWYGTGTQ